jgi:hypothetical protein
VFSGFLPAINHRAHVSREHDDMTDHRWLFAEGSGAYTVDWITGNQNGALSNAKFGSPGRYNLGGYIQLSNQANSHVDFAQPIGQFGTDSFTVMLWFATQQTNQLFDVVGNRTASSNGSFFAVRMTAKGQITAEVDQDGSGTNYCGVESVQGGLNDGRWHHIAVVRAGPSLALFVDGQWSVEGAGKGVAAINNGNPFRLGASLPTWVSPNAAYTDLCVFTGELSADEILHVYRFH